MNLGLGVLIQSWTLQRCNSIVLESFMLVILAGVKYYFSCSLH